MSKASHRVTVARNHAEASEILNKLMRDAAPGDQDLLETFQVEVLPCRDSITGLDRGAKCIFAWPKGQAFSPANILAVVYGDAKVTAEAERRGFFG